MSFWKNRSVLVTGGAGFIGSNLTQRLVELGAKVRVLDNLERGKLEYLKDVLDQIDFQKGDLRASEVCFEICKGMDVIFHLASKVGGIRCYLDKPGQVMTQNVLIDTNMIEAAKAQGVGFYLYASSAHVYPIELQQSPDAPPIREEQAIPAHPELSYGWAKLLGEREIEYTIAEGAELKAVIVRLIGAYGPNQDLDLDTGSAIPVFIRRAIEYPQRKPFVILGTGEETRSYCYISDVLDAMLLAIEKLDNQRLIGPINVGSETRIKIKDLVDEIIDISGKDIEVVNDLSHPTVIWGQVLDCSKAREILDNWVPKVSLREGLEKVYSHIQERLGRERSCVY